MAEFLELLFQFVFEVIFNLIDAAKHWRFTLAAVLSAGAIVLLQCLGPDSFWTDALSVVLALAGVVAGLLWEAGSRR
jgi:hypothetical protein